MSYLNRVPFTFVDRQGAKIHSNEAIFDEIRYLLFLCRRSWLTGVIIRHFRAFLDQSKTGFGRG